MAQIADDYEEPWYVYENVATRARACGIAVDQQTVNRVLVDLVKNGLAKAYRIPIGGNITEAEHAPPPDEVGGYYFWITATGKDCHLATRAREMWPFDDEGELRSDWTPPES